MNTTQQPGPAEVRTSDQLGPLPPAALTVVHNASTMERQVSTHGVAYYGSNWYAEHECYTADQMRAYAAEQVAAERERWRAQVRWHLQQTTMSIYGTQPECKAARDALQRLLDDED